jgi:hypothetical protein
MSGATPRPPDGPDEEQSAGSRPSGPATETEGPHVVRDSRPWTVVGLVLLVIFLGILVWAVVLPAVR